MFDSKDLCEEDIGVIRLIPMCILRDISKNKSHGYGDLKKEIPGLIETISYGTSADIEIIEMLDDMTPHHSLMIHIECVDRDRTVFEMVELDGDDGEELYLTRCFENIMRSSWKHYHVIISLERIDDETLAYHRFM